MRHVAWCFVLLLFACGRAPETETPTPTLPDPEASYVCGAPDAPTGGRLVVGVLVPTHPPVVIADELPPGALEEFLAAEQARPDSLDPETKFDEDGIEEPVIPEEAILGEPLENLRSSATSAGRILGVAVVLRQVTIDQCDAVPVLLVRDDPVQEQRGLARFRETGGVVFTDRQQLVDAARDALKASPLVHRLPEDPLRVVEARRDGGAVFVRLAAPAAARVVDEDGAIVWSAPEPSATLRFPAPATEPEFTSRRLVVHWEGDGLALRRAWPLDELVPVVDRQVLTSDDVVAGGTLAVRTLFFDAETRAPAAGQREVFRLLSSTGAELARTEATSDAHGTMDVRLAVPEDAAPENAVLVVGAKRLPVRIRREHRVSVVTDRGLYQEDDTVHVRVLVHRFPSGRPANGAEVVLRHRTPQGRAGERTVTASAHGIASWTFDLAGAPLGNHVVEARIDSKARASTDFKVRAFEKPLFDVSLDPSEVTLRAGEAAPVTVTARFFNGAPVAGAKVVAYSGNQKGRTDGEGRFRFEARAGVGNILVRVWTAEGRWSDAWLQVRAAGDMRRPISLEPRGDLVRGFPCAFDLRAPVGATVSINGAEAETVALDNEGRGVVRWAAYGERVTFLVRAGDAEETFEFDVVDADLKPDRRLATVGETLGVSLRGRQSVYLDVVREGAVVRTLVGRDRIEIPLTPDLAGMLTLVAYEVDADGPTRASEARVLVLRGRELAVDAQPEREAYRPGDEATVDVAVRNRAGDPVAAALGYWAVDEAVLAIRPWNSGYETVFDVLPAKARYWGLADSAEGRADASVRSALGGVRRTDLSRAFPIRHRRLPELHEQRARRVRGEFGAALDGTKAAVVAAIAAVPIREQRAFASLRQLLAWHVAEGYLDRAALVDAWGKSLAFEEDPVYGEFRWRSTGPDLVAGTADDLNDTWWIGDLLNRLPKRLRRFYGIARARGVLGGTVMTYNSVIGLGGGAGGGRRGRGGRRNLRASGGSGVAAYPTPPRRDFPPTLVFVPETMTGPDGRARLTVPLADSITTWRMRLVASAADGATGVATTRIRVTQPLHVEPWVASLLTEGDRIDVPVAVRNETGAAFETDVHAKATPPLEIVGASHVRVAVAPGGTAAAVFRVRANAPGKGEVHIAAAAGGLRDTVVRVVNVRRAEREIVETVATRLGGDAAWMPSFSRPRRGSLRLDLYPSPAADALAGFEGLIRAPYG